MNSCRILHAGDLIIDSGNSRLTDTDRRIQLVEGMGFFFMGMGMSGGESSARHGPSLMPGGNRAAYDIVGHLLEAASARVGEKPCVAYLGPGSAGHYVKMVHNGIEYALMPALINRARLVVFLVSGTSKASIFSEVLDGPKDPLLLPAQLIQPQDGALVWLADKAAAAQRDRPAFSQNREDVQ